MTYMAKLISYGILSTNKNSVNIGHLVKAQCEFCGRKFGSIEGAKKCEYEHLVIDLLKQRQDDFYNWHI